LYPFFIIRLYDYFPIDIETLGLCNPIKYLQMKEDTSPVFHRNFGNGFRHSGCYFSIMLTDDDLNLILNYLSKTAGKAFRSIDDLLAEGTEGFLNLTEKIDDDVLPIFVSLFKSSRRGSEFFHKLTGDLDESTGNRAALRRTRRGAKAFLKRYTDLILAQEESGGNFNPLLAYLPPGCFDDLAFIQSRQSFFLRQTADTINEFLMTACRCPVAFGPGGQEEAWKWFWNYVLKT
jgi:hypothetical protein